MEVHFKSHKQLHLTLAIINSIFFFIRGLMFYQIMSVSVEPLGGSLRRLLKEVSGEVLSEVSKMVF